MQRENRNFRTQPPVKVGDEFDVSIEAVGEKGDGIAKKDGFVIFVPATQEGQNVKIRITRVLRKVGFAEVVGEGAAPVDDEAQEAQPADEASQEEAPAEEAGEGPAAEDTEDFGEEGEEPKKEL